MKTVLITGGAGFLGSHLTDRFLRASWNVIVLDNLITGSTDNIGHLIGEANFKFIRYDVTDYLFFEEEIDLILHFACPASPFDYAKHPIHTMKVDSLGTLNTLGLAKKKKGPVCLCFHIRDIRKPGSSPPERRVLGKCQSGGHPVGL